MRRDLWVGLALAASWFAVWGLVTRIPGRTWVAGLTSAAVIAVMFGCGVWSFHAMAATSIAGAIKVGARVNLPG